MQDYLNQAWELVQKHLETNQFLTGGVFLGAIAGIVAAIRSYPARIYRWLVQRAFIEIEIIQKDTAFLWFNDWLAEQKYSQTWARWLTVRTVWKKKDDNQPASPYSVEEDQRRADFILSPAPGRHWLWWKGHFLVVERERKDRPAATEGQGSKVSFEQEVFNVSILTWRRQAVIDLLRDIRDHAEPPDDNRITIHTPRYGNWENNMKRRPRAVDSVVLEAGFLEDLVAKVKWFRENEQWYIDRGIPHRLGILLDGPPGGGKTSTVAALATALRMDLAILNVGSPDLDDGELQSLITKIPPNTIVLCEDIDCLWNQRKADADVENKVTFSGLLNAIDGVASGEGRILVMTANYPEKLDSALIRPGRVDIRRTIKRANSEQATRLFTNFFPNCAERGVDLAREFGVRCGGEKYSMAALQGLLMKYPEDAQTVIDNISELTDETACSSTQPA